MPQKFSDCFGQFDFANTEETALTFKSTLMIVNCLCYSNISWGITFTHLPSNSYHNNYVTFLF